MSGRNVWRELRDGGLLLLVLAAAGCGSAGRPGESAPADAAPEAPAFPVAPEWDFEEARQFDFWVGQWEVNLRTLGEDLEWREERQGEARVYPVLGGRAILELWDEDRLKGFSLRYYDRENDRWEAWLDWPGPNRSALSQLTGQFRHGRAEFYFEFADAQGESVLGRYTFSDIGPDRLRWDDGYSTDGGRSWSSNWIMEFTRVAAMPPPLAGDTVLTWETGERCQGETYRFLDRLAGDWSGTVRAHQAGPRTRESPARLRGFKILDGCAVLTILERDGEDAFEELGVHTYHVGLGRYESGFLDNRSSEGLTRFLGEKAGDRIDLRDRSEPDTDDATRRILLEFAAPGDLRVWWEERPDPEAAWTTVASGELSRPVE